MPSLDFAEAKRLISIRDVLRLVDWVPFQTYPDHARGKCPLHLSGNQNSRSFAVNYLDNSWFCHRCKTGGDQLRLAALLLKLPVYHVAVDLCRKIAGRVPYLPGKCGTGRGTVKGGPDHAAN